MSQKNFNGVRIKVVNFLSNVVMGETSPNFAQKKEILVVHIIEEDFHNVMKIS
jgi:hypothetical protein